MEKFNHETVMKRKNCDEETTTTTTTTTRTTTTTTKMETILQGFLVWIELTKSSMEIGDLVPSFRILSKYQTDPKTPSSPFSRMTSKKKNKKKKRILENDFYDNPLCKKSDDKQLHLRTESQAC